MSDTNNTKSQQNKQNQTGHRGHSHARVFARGEQMSLVFVERRFGSSSRIVSTLADGRIIYPATLRFRPRHGDTINCSVVWRENGRGNAFGLAMPSQPYTLTPDRWVPDSELATCLVVNLVFSQRDKKDGVIAFHEGRAVFPARGFEKRTPVGQAVQCLLHEAGSIAYGTPLNPEQTTSSTALAKLAEVIGEVTEIDLHYVVVKTARVKPGLRTATTEKDLVIAPEYRSTWEILSSNGLTVSATSSAKDVNRAYRAKRAKVSTDVILAPFGGLEKAPLAVRRSAEFFCAALDEAKERAMKIIERHAAKSTTTPAAPEKPAETASAIIAPPAAPEKPAETDAVPSKETVTTEAEGAEPTEEALDAMFVLLTNGTSFEDVCLKHGQGAAGCIADAARIVLGDKDGTKEDAVFSLAAGLAGCAEVEVFQQLKKTAQRLFLTTAQKAVGDGIIAAATPPTPAK